MAAASLIAEAAATAAAAARAAAQAKVNDGTARLADVLALLKTGGAA